MKVLLCGEGDHDIGQASYWNEHLREYEIVDGWLQFFVRAVKGHDLSFSVKRRVELQINPREGRGLQPLPYGHGAKALLAKLAAISGGYDILIFMVDADSPHVRDWRRKINEVRIGFDRIDGDVVCIPCVPMSASECWLMADGDAWVTVANYGGYLLPKNPERTWGMRNDPQGGHPHRLFKRVCDSAGLNDNRDTRVRIASETDLVVARTKCATSLGSFFLELEAA